MAAIRRAVCFGRKGDMSMDALGKPARRMFYVVIAGLTLSLTFNVWDSIEKTKLNQQYAQLIEQRSEQIEEIEESFQLYRKLNKLYDEEIKRGNKINNDRDIINKRTQDVLNSLIDLRDELYLLKLKKNATQ